MERVDPLGSTASARGVVTGAVGRIRGPEELVVIMEVAGIRHHGIMVRRAEDRLRVEC